MKLLIDGVFFQLAQSGIARIWASILPRLARTPGLEICMLNRGNAPKIAGIELVEFPSYKLHANTAADSFLIDMFCSEYGADVFMSTYYTTPVSVPSVLIVYDMIPEILGFDLRDRPWLEKQTAVSFASAYACISEQTQSDLERFYPGTRAHSVVAHCGVETVTFHPKSSDQIQSFRSKFGLTKPYYLFVGSREQHLGYKNAMIAFRAAQGIRNRDFEFLCVGGEPNINDEAMAWLPANVTARQITLGDQDLACAYSGAEALIFPSLYEGFGLPVIEAMACGCPVITTSRGSLKEIAGDAAWLVSGDDVSELKAAMLGIIEPEQRARLSQLGLQHAARFQWHSMTEKLNQLMVMTAERNRRGELKRFFQEWRRVRYIQYAVDTA